MSTSPTSYAVADAFGVRGQSVIVTGAAGRIGHGVAEAFVANGASVLLSDQDTPRLPEAAAALGDKHAGAGGRAVPHAADLRDPDALRGLVAAAVERFGGLHTIVHCGAIITSGHILEETDADFDRLFHTNLRSAWILAQSSIPHLRQTHGCVIHIASVNGHRALFPCSLYGATKAGLINMARELAAEFGRDRVRFNTISPGAIGHWSFESMGEMLHPPHDRALLDAFLEESRRHEGGPQPLPMRGLPYDVAMAAIYLASPAARFVTGADLLVDGGKLHMFEHQHGSGDETRRDFWRRVRAHLRALPADAWRAERPHWVDR